MASMKAKKKCCRDRPRCKVCPVVLKRLADAGLLERESKRRYSFDAKPPKAAVAAARTV
ncbi:hypothetical protein [Jiangella endophytica]|uniref:hypothetical protein n=1 Tax=Jiangella endophytica TaxID=1623398 RepID=UPI0013007604|nr:hypothetical protein [Jiangella endophytica]